LVVEMSSIGAEILCLIVPEEDNECFVVRDLFGSSGALSFAALDFLVVKALEIDIFANMAAKVTNGPDKMG
jgi:hypothetical protein